MNRVQIPVSPDEVRQTLSDLDGVTAMMAADLRAAWEIERELAIAKAEAQSKKQLLLDVENATTMEAYASGKIDGKNAETRNTQLTAYLNADERVQEARAAVQEAEARSESLAQALQEKRDWYKHGSYRLSALRAKAELFNTLIAAGLAASNDGSDNELF
ncbi:MAG TPA: hypothetical protein PLD43_11940 [Anaerolineae bacterium]|nr:hypothetical protein [Anaerolineae bacterium]